MCSGVGKSGSPAPKPITSSPAAFSAFALASMARVADSATAAIRAETRGLGELAIAPMLAQVQLPVHTVIARWYPLLVSLTGTPPHVAGGGPGWRARQGPG